MSARWVVLAALCWTACSAARQDTKAQRGAVRDAAAGKVAGASTAVSLPPRAAADGVPGASPPRAAADGVPGGSLPRAAGAGSWSPWRVVGGSPATVVTIGPRVAGLGQWLTTPAHAPRALSLDLPGGVRVKLGPGTLVWAFERAPDALVLARGRLTVQRLPDAPRVGESPQRIVTAQATVSLTAAAELVVGARSDKPGAAAVGVIVLRGAVELLRFGAAAQALVAEQSRWPVIPGLALRGAKTSDEAQRALDDALRPTRARTALADADAHLTTAIKTAAALRAEGDRLLAAVSPRHAAVASSAPVTAPPTTEAQIRAYQRSLTDHARRAHAARQALQLAVEQSLLAHALECGAPIPAAPSCAILQRWRERFERALIAAR